MIRVAFVIDTIESPTAGTEKQLLMLIKNLDRTKFVPLLCVLRSSEWLENQFSDCELIYIGFSSLKKPMSYYNVICFSNILRKRQVDIVMTYFVDGNKVGVVAGKLAGIKAVVSNRRNQGYWRTNFFEVYFQKFLNKLVDCFLANSENTKRWAVNKEGIAPQKIKVIYNSLQTDIYGKASKKDKKGFRSALGLPEDSILVGIVANLRPVKAIDIFIKAARNVSKEKPHVCFLVVGDGADRAMLEQLGSDLGLNGKIRFLGSRHDVPRILSFLDVGVLSSLSESFSNSIIEYMAAGLAVVCTDVGGASEVIRNGVNGYLVVPGEVKDLSSKIVDIIDNNPEAMGQINREKVISLFSQYKITNQYQEFFTEII